MVHQGDLENEWPRYACPGPSLAQPADHMGCLSLSVGCACVKMHRAWPGGQRFEGEVVCAVCFAALGRCPCRADPKCE